MNCVDTRSRGMPWASIEGETRSTRHIERSIFGDRKKNCTTDRPDQIPIRWPRYVWTHRSLTFHDLQHLLYITFYIQIHSLWSAWAGICSTGEVFYSFGSHVSPGGICRDSSSMCIHRVGSTEYYLQHIIIDHFLERVYITCMLYCSIPGMFPHELKRIIHTSLPRLSEYQYRYY